MLFVFMDVCVREPDPLALELQTVLSCPVGPLQEWSVLLTIEPFLPPPHAYAFYLAPVSTNLEFLCAGQVAFD